MPFLTGNSSLDPLLEFRLWTSSIDRLRGGCANYRLLSWGSPFVGSALLEQCNVNIVLGHRSREDMRSLISSLKGIINTFLNGQLVPQETEFLDFLSCSLRAT